MRSGEGEGRGPERGQRGLCGLGSPPQAGTAPAPPRSPLPGIIPAVLRSRASFTRSEPGRRSRHVAWEEAPRRGWMHSSTCSRGRAEHFLPPKQALSWVHCSRKLPGWFRSHGDRPRPRGQCAVPSCGDFCSFPTPSGLRVCFNERASNSDSSVSSERHRVDLPVRLRSIGLRKAETARPRVPAGGQREDSPVRLGEESFLLL